MKLDFTNIETKEELHNYLNEALEFPQYYGKNLDALSDMINEFYSSEKFELKGKENLICCFENYGKKIIDILEH